MYYCALGDVTVVGSSPEALVKLNQRHAQLRPIAGTRPRSDDAAVDAARETQLRADPKENAEHIMWWILRAMIWGAWRAPVRCASTPTAASSATVTSCTW